MSSMAFGALVRTRQEQGKGESDKAAGKPGLKTYVDTLAALVPAEVLIAHAAILTSTTSTKKGKDGKAVTTITEPSTLRAAFVAFIVLSAVFYVVGFQKKKWGVGAIVGLFVPPIAFVLWTMAQKSTAFDALDTGLKQSDRELIVIVGTLALGLIATAVPIVVNKAAKKE